MSLLNQLLKSGILTTIRSVFIFLPGISTSLFAQQTLSPDALIADANKYREVISSQHINPFTKISQAEFHQRMDSLIAFHTEEGYNSFIVEMLRINALIGDEHTILFPAAGYSLPLQFDVFEEGLAITASDSSHRQYLLHRILSINQVPWSGIDSLFRTIVKQDNASYYKFFLSYYARHADILNGLGITGDDLTLTLQLLSPLGDTVVAMIHPYDKAHKIEWIKAAPYATLLAYSENRNYWYRFDKIRSTLYFNYSHCSNEEDESFKEFNKKMFTVIDEIKPEKLVLDLRFNGGGNSGVLQPFIQQIKKHYLNTHGHFFVLTGRKVMSSALMNAIELQQTTHAIFIGETTGGNINHFGETQSYLLPNTMARATYSTKYWENRKGHDGPFVPDIIISYSLADLLRSYDAALETALKH